MPWATKEDLQEWVEDPLAQKFRDHLKVRLETLAKNLRTAARAGTLEQCRAIDAKMSAVEEILEEMETQDEARV